MIFTLLDDELIYLIRQGNKEAERLLFSRYEKSLGFFLSRIENYIYQNIDQEQIMSIYYESYLKSLKCYDYKKGLFLTYLKNYFRYALIRYYNENLDYFNNERLLEENEEIKINNLKLYDGNYILNQFSFNDALYKLKEKDMTLYHILILYLQGYSYNEIEKITNIKEKQIYYALTKALSFFKSLFK